jgi:hypothetical protein
MNAISRMGKYRIGNFAEISGTLARSCVDESNKEQIILPPVFDFCKHIISTQNERKVKYDRYFC